MDRELLLLVLCAWVVAPLVAVGALWANRRREPAREPRAVAGRELEASALRRLAGPLLPAALGLVGLLGWALQEPESAEMPPWPAILLCALPALVCGRALARGVQSLRARAEGPAVTVGLLRTRIVIEPAFANSLDPSARAAVLAHEQAHARHRDPLRLWLGQLATDLQWPFRGARARLDAYRAAVELARDDEARAEVDGTDLATAVLAATRQGQQRLFAGAGIAAAESELRIRIERLLAPVPAATVPAGRDLRWLIVPAALGLSLGLGLHFGEAVIRWGCRWPASGSAPLP